MDIVFLKISFRTSNNHSRKTSEMSEIGDISINIDAALEALKSDHSLAAKTSPVTPNSNAKFALQNGRGRGGRTRGRAGGKAQSRGRG